MIGTSPEGVRPFPIIRSTPGPLSLARIPWSQLVLALDTPADFTVSLPSSPLAGDIVEVSDSTGIAASHPITIDGNGKNINGDPSLVLATNFGSAMLQYGAGAWNVVASSTQASSSIVTTLIIQSTPGNASSQTSISQASLVTTNATPANLFSFTPRPNTSVRVYGSISAIRSTGADDYGVDLVAAFRVDGAGVVTNRLASTPALEVAAVAALGAPVLDTDGTNILCPVSGVVGQTWLWGGSFSVEERSTTP
jgi:hypothetical protein